MIRSFKLFTFILAVTLIALPAIASFNITSERENSKYLCIFDHQNKLDKKILQHCDNCSFYCDDNTNITISLDSLVSDIYLYVISYEQPFKINQIITTYSRAPPLNI